MPEELFTLKEIAQRLKVTTRTVQNYRDQGILPYRQLGGLIRYCWKDVYLAFTYHEAIRKDDSFEITEEKAAA